MVTILHKVEKLKHIKFSGHTAVDQINKFHL